MDGWMVKPPSWKTRSTSSICTGCSNNTAAYSRQSAWGFKLCMFTLYACYLLYIYNATSYLIYHLPIDFLKVSYHLIRSKISQAANISCSDSIIMHSMECISFLKVYI